MMKFNWAGYFTQITTLRVDFPNTLQINCTNLNETVFEYNRVRNRCFTTRRLLSAVCFTRFVYASVSVAHVCVVPQYNVTHNSGLYACIFLCWNVSVSTSSYLFHCKLAFLR